MVVHVSSEWVLPEEGEGWVSYSSSEVSVWVSFISLGVSWGGMTRRVLLGEQVCLLSSPNQVEAPPPLCSSLPIGGARAPEDCPTDGWVLSLFLRFQGCRLLGVDTGGNIVDGIPILCGS